MPEVNYTWVPEKNQDRLPSFDSLDRVVHQNIIYYSLANYLTAKYQREEDDPVYRDLLYFKLTQGYELSGTRQDLLTLVDERRPFTDIIFESRVNPTERISLAFDGRYNHYDNIITTFVATGAFSDRWGDTASIAYRYAKDQVEYMESALVLSYFKPFAFTYQSRYSFDKHDFLENLYTLEYRHQCWSVMLSYRERPDNNEFLIGFTLYGVGPLGDIRVF
jgi:LPS-assembly protein